MSEALPTLAVTSPSARNLPGTTQAEPIATNRETLAISVVICTLNRRTSLCRTLDSLLSQTCTRPYEVLVVDNGSSDDSVAAAEAYASRFRVTLRVMKELETGLSNARNRALAEANAPRVVFIDDDVSCRPGFVESHLDAFAEPDVIATGGRILPVLPASTPGWFRQLLPSEIGGPTARYDFGEHTVEVGPRWRKPPPCGANMGLHREAALELGGFRSDLGWGNGLIPGEESELLKKLQEHGRILYVPRATVDHHIDASKVEEPYFVRWYRGHGRSTILMNPPDGILHRVQRIFSELQKGATWALRKHLRRRSVNDRSYGEALRKEAKAVGKLYQLLGR